MYIRYMKHYTYTFAEFRLVPQLPPMVFINFIKGDFIMIQNNDINLNILNFHVLLISFFIGVK